MKADALLQVLPGLVSQHLDAVYILEKLVEERRRQIVNANDPGDQTRSLCFNFIIKALPPSKADALQVLAGLVSQHLNVVSSHQKLAERGVDKKINGKLTLVHHPAWNQTRSSCFNFDNTVFALKAEAHRLL